MQAKITAEQFKAATGLDPVDDDLARCNCPYVGKPGHFFCGWSKKHNKPRFMCDTVDEKE